MASPHNGSLADEDDNDNLELNESDIEEIVELDEDGRQDGMDTDSDNGIPEEDETVRDEEVNETTGLDTSLTHFASHHPSALFAIAAHPIDSNLVASGGADDVGYLWKADTGGEVVRLSGHTDSVSAVAWSFDGELIATGGMDGRVRIWRHVRPIAPSPQNAFYATWEFLTSLDDGPDEVMWLAWHPKGNVLAAGSNAGAVWMWSLPSGKTMGVLSHHTTPSTTGIWSPPSAGKRLLTASGAPEPTLALWDPHLSLSEPEHRWSFAAVQGGDRRFALAGGINCLAANSAGTIGLVGGQADPVESSSALRLVNLAAGGKPIGALEGGHDPGASIEAVAWANLSASVGIWLSAATDGKVCAWDATTGRPRWVGSHDGPVSCLSVLEGMSAEGGSGESGGGGGGGGVVVTGSVDRTVRCWDLRTGAVLGEPKIGHRAVIHTLAVTADRTRTVSGGDDGVGRVHAL